MVASFPGSPERDIAFRVPESLGTRLSQRGTRDGSQLLQERGSLT